MEYTKEELELIEESLHVCRLDFDPALSIENDEDVLQALNTHRGIHYMNTEKQKIAHGIFKKHGLWEDGKTTQVEHDRQLLEKKIKLAREFHESRTEQVARLKELQERITDKITEIEQKPLKIREEMNQKHDALKAEAIKNAEYVIESYEKEWEMVLKEQREDFENKIQHATKQLHEQVELLKIEERQKINDAFKEYDELVKLKSEYEILEGRYERDLKRYEEENAKSDANLFDLTIKELKELADNRGLAYTARILKADLVNLIEQGE